MLKKLILAIVMLAATMGSAFAQVDVNKADQASLDSVKGIGPKMSKTILDERKKGGDFKDWADFESRVKGVREKKAIKLSEAGLMVNGRPRGKASDADKEDRKSGSGAKSKKEMKKNDSKG
ncbi:MAG TPA: DUF655 domain-containing protein [Noviherbaspirillum sp.]|uniref:ComEA family DNA-binding protein n=1 Tax=Noviherbaspirillum sp. TaxID=1926288 RepID=UPI002B47CE29|nr:DUF655 domain-containing protein [Noviherbaspirillum sp.]HJV86546.1 DUF655 domain-containing protein [Noviherbaspirillum sp.]